MQYLVLLWAVDADILSGTIVTNLRIKRSQLWHLDKCSEAFLLYDVIGDGELVVGRLLRKDRSPSIKAIDALLFECLRT